MRVAKSGQWWNITDKGHFVNNPACYTEKPDIGIFMDEWKSPMILNLVKEVYSTENLQRRLQRRMKEEMLDTTLEQTCSEKFQASITAIGLKLLLDFKTRRYIIK